MGRIADEQLRQRKANYTRLNTAIYLVVTFDLKGSAGRNAVYARFRRWLERLMGPENTVRAIKQSYLVKSMYGEEDVTSEMVRELLKQDSLIVMRLQPGHAYRMPAAARRKAKAFFDDLSEAEGPL